MNKLFFAVVLLFGSAEICKSQDIIVTAWVGGGEHNFSFHSNQGSKLSYSIVGGTVFFNSSNSDFVDFSDASLTARLFDAGFFVSVLGNGVFTFRCLSECDLDVEGLGGGVITASARVLSPYYHYFLLFSNEGAVFYNAARDIESRLYYDSGVCASCDFQKSCRSEYRNIFYLSGMRRAVSGASSSTMSWGHDIFRWYDYNSHLLEADRNLGDLHCEDSGSLVQSAISLYFSGDIDKFSESIQMMSERDVYLLWLGWPNSPQEIASSTFDIVRKLKGLDDNFLSFSGEDDGVKQVLSASLIYDDFFLDDYANYLSLFGYQHRNEDKFVHALLRYLQPAIKHGMSGKALSFLRSGWIPERNMDEVSAHFLMMLSLYGGKNDFLEFVFAESPEIYGSRVRMHVSERLALYGFDVQALDWQPD